MYGWIDCVYVSMSVAKKTDLCHFWLVFDIGSDKWRHRQNESYFKIVRSRAYVLSHNSTLERRAIIRANHVLVFHMLQLMTQVAASKMANMWQQISSHWATFNDYRPNQQWNSRHFYFHFWKLAWICSKLNHVESDSQSTYRIIRYSLFYYILS